MFIPSVFTTAKIDKSALVPINEQTDKANVECIHDGVLVSPKEEQNPVICGKIDGKEWYEVKWKDPDIGKQVSHVLMYGSEQTNAGQKRR